MSISICPACENCHSGKALWHRIYEIDVLHGKLELVPGLRSWVEEKLGSGPEVENQKIIRTTNLISGEGALFNSLRSRRPTARFPETDLESLVEEHRSNCPFCSPEERTPGERFGRIRGNIALRRPIWPNMTDTTV